MITIDPQAELRRARALKKIVDASGDIRRMLAKLDQAHAGRHGESRARGNVVRAARRLIRIIDNQATEPRHDA